MNRYQGCLAIAILLTLVAWSFRVYHAFMVGNILLAFITDSFMGFPYTHIISLISAPFWLFGFGAIFGEEGNGS